MQKLKAGRWLLIALTAIALTNCNTDNTSSSDAGSETVTMAAPSVPAFNRDSAFAYVALQVAFGPRIPNTSPHDACREWLVEKLKTFGADVKEQPFRAEAYTGEILKGTNIIASFNPENNKRILLGAHWDTRPFADSPLSEVRRNEGVLGADDGGSGVAVLLEIARQIGQNPMDLGVDIVLFDAEDYGESGADNPESWGLGAQYWSRNIRYGADKPRYGILLDMVGARGARFAREQYSVYFARPVVDKVWQLGQNMGYSNYFVNAEVGGITDDHYFVNTIAQIPMIDIINRPLETQTGFGEYWHTHDDDMDVIDKRTLGAVGQVVLAVLYRENAGTL